LKISFSKSRNGERRKRMKALNEEMRTIAILLLVSMTLMSSMPLIKANGITIYIRADGSIDPSTAPIATVDNTTYTFTGNINDSIVVERDSITVDGQGYTVQGTGNRTGITLSGRSNVTIKNMEITTFDYGIGLSYSSGSSISGNKIRANKYGISLDSSSNASISGNNITNNEHDGIGLYSYSNNNSIYWNNLTNNGYGILLSSSSSNNSIYGNNVTNDFEGIWLYYSLNNSVSGNAVTANNEYGIYLGSSSNNSVSGNNVTNNRGGINLYYSSNNNNVSRNNVTNNMYGIWLYYSLNNNVSGNIVTNNLYGFWLDFSSNNLIFHNNFLSNTPQAVSTASLNAWDDDYPSGGNYWSDYKGTDMYRGNHQNETGSDWIVDTPYVIAANNTDHYPLMTPYVAVHDVAVANVTCFKTVVGQGFGLNASVALANFGDHTEAINVSICYVGAAQSVLYSTGSNLDSVLNGTSTVVVLTWNTMGISYGNYTLGAYASPVPGETNTTNNTFWDGWVFVTVPDDIDGDGEVGLADLVLLATAYESHCADYNYPGEPASTKWYPNADVNNDGIVNLQDLVILAQHYGQHYP
jgi:parallel beta-helix repeat protein